jgi:hypothetical protein
VEFESYVKRALEMEDLPLRRGSVGETWRGVSFFGTLKDMYRRLW